MDRIVYIVFLMGMGVGCLMVEWIVMWFLFCVDDCKVSKILSIWVVSCLLVWGVCFLVIVEIKFSSLRLCKFLKVRVVFGLVGLEESGLMLWLSI